MKEEWIPSRRMLCKSLLFNLYDLQCPVFLKWVPKLKKKKNLKKSHFCFCVDNLVFLIDWQHWQDHALNWLWKMFCNIFHVFAQARLFLSGKLTRAFLEMPKVCKRKVKMWVCLYYFTPAEKKKKSFCGSRPNWVYVCVCMVVFVLRMISRDTGKHTWFFCTFHPSHNQVTCLIKDFLN